MNSIRTSIPNSTRCRMTCRANYALMPCCWSSLDRCSGRPRVDTLKGSRHANMKELRFDAADGVWRVAFAFDPKRNAVLLIAGDKSGGGEKRFYRQLIAKADERLDEHLSRTKKKGK